MSETFSRHRRLWGIYHADLDYARQLGHPLRTVIEASTQLAAEEAAIRLGFGDARAQQVTPEQIKLAQWQSLRRRLHRSQHGPKPGRGIRV